MQTVIVVLQTVAQALLRRMSTERRTFCCSRPVPAAAPLTVEAVADLLVHMVAWAAPRLAVADELRALRAVVLLARLHNR